MNCNTAQEVTIKKVVNGGFGLASLPDGKTVLVRHGLPGETLAISITEQQQRFAYASIIEVLQPHVDRVAPPCPYYGKCGGCDFQHASYPLQCLVKRDIIADLFRRSPSRHVASMQNMVPGVLEAPQPFGYRQRLRLSLDDHGKPGFRRFRSHDIVPVQRCLLAPERVCECLSSLTRQDSFKALAGNTREVEILLNPLDETLCLLFHLQRQPRPADRQQAVTLCRNIPAVTRIFFSGERFALEGPYPSAMKAEGKQLSMLLPGDPSLHLTWEAGGFCQVNTAQNAVLIKRVLELAAPNQSHRILDLYCGMGNLSLSLALCSAHVFGVESQGAAIRSARYNSSLNRITNTHFEKSDVTAACERLLASGDCFDIVVCDPPRQGIPGLAPILSRLVRRRLIYVSCDPATLCRDLADLCTEGFSIQQVQPIDMFPQTHHIETVVRLEKN